MFSTPDFLSFAITRFATSISSAVGRRAQTCQEEIFDDFFIRFACFQKVRDACAAFPPIRSVTTGEVIMIIACTGLDTFLSTGGIARSAW